MLLFDLNSVKSTDLRVVAAACRVGDEKQRDGNTLQFRADGIGDSGGRLGRRLLGWDVLALTTRGRKTGEPRTVLLNYLKDGDAFVVIGSNAGDEHDPAWWMNLKAAGEGTVVVGGERWRVRPRVAEGPERERLWPKLCDAYPGMRDYVRIMGQELTVVVLERV